MPRALPSRRPVVVVGDVGLDVLVRPTSPPAHGDDTPSETRILPGGAGGNTASWLACAGAPVALVCRIGDDDAAVASRRRLDADGVVCRLVTDDRRSTCVVVVVLDQDGERTMLPDRGASAALDAADLDLVGAARPRWPVVTSMWTCGRTCTSAGSCSSTSGRAPPGWPHSTTPAPWDGRRRWIRRRPATCAE